MYKDKALVCLNLNYGHYNSKSPVCSEYFISIYDNIIEESEKYESCYIINDNHSPNDGEFLFLPPHCISGTLEALNLPHRHHLIKSKIVENLYKNHLSGFKSPHNKILITNQFKEITLCGFNLSTDIIPTALDALQLGLKPTVVAHLSGDMTKELKQKSLDYLKLFLQIE